MTGMNKIALLLMLSVQANALAEIVVIVNKANKIQKIDISGLQDIYMGRKHAFDDGSMALPIDQAKLRSEFYEKLTNRPIAQINAYWARIMFSGEASPPRIMPDDTSVINIVKENPGAIGYILKDNRSKAVKE